MLIYQERITRKCRVTFFPSQNTRLGKGKVLKKILALRADKKFHEKNIQNVGFREKIHGKKGFTGVPKKVVFNFPPLFNFFLCPLNFYIFLLKLILKDGQDFLSKIQVFLEDVFEKNSENI